MRELETQAAVAAGLREVIPAMGLRGVLAVFAILFAVAPAARPETLSGTVVDPQRLAIAGAEVTLVCGGVSDVRRTDGRGGFTFSREAFREDCKIRAVYPNFAALELTVGGQRSFSLQLRLAELKQTVDARTDRLQASSLSSVTLSGEDLRKISTNGEDLLSYAKQIAGLNSGADRIYVDGMPADHAPPADRIESISINSDPYSAEFSDGGDAHIDIATRKVSRSFGVSSAGGSLGSRVPDGLNSGLSSTSKTATLGLVGPVPFVPLGFTSNASYTEREGELPILATVPLVQGSSIVAVSAASATDSYARFDVAADYSLRDAVRVNAALSVFTSRQTNMNVAEISLPDSGASQDTTVYEFRTAFSAIGKDYVDRGGVSAEWSDSKMNANSGGMGVSVSGAFIGGGASITKRDGEWSGWTIKDVLQPVRKSHNWSAGATVSRREDREAVVPNSHGQIFFDDAADYVSSAKTGAGTGTGAILEGEGTGQYVSYFAAPFVETELVRRSKLLVRGGLRADVQSAVGTEVSPRLSAIAAVHGFVLKAGGGMFVQPLASNVVLGVLDDDGNHLRQFLIKGASVSSDLGAAAGVGGPVVVSKIAPELVAARNWISSVSVEHAFGRFLPGVEYTWTDGTHLLGSERLASGGLGGTATGWTDLLESNRGQRKEQIRTLAEYAVGGQRFTARYEWTRARDDTDGPFSFPAVQGDAAGEWGPASDAAAHNVTLVANSTLGKVVSLSAVESWHSATPLNLTSGLDPAGDGLYTDRAGLPRNSGRGAQYNSMDLYMYRRVGMPKAFSESSRKMNLDVNVQVFNLLDNKDYSSYGTVLGSALLGQPLAAAPGRSFRFSLSVSR